MGEVYRIFSKQSLDEEIVRAALNSDFHDLTFAFNIRSLISLAQLGSGEQLGWLDNSQKKHLLSCPLIQTKIDSSVTEGHSTPK